METNTYTINATVSQRALEKVTRLFNASLTDILNELLQNARRAGASEVRMAITQAGTLVVEDNGRGILDPKILLTLGESDWSEGTTKREDPAGMGVFSLSNRGATIRSANWQMRLKPEHFCGQKAITVEAASPIEGTRVEFQLSERELKEPHLASLIGASARFYPLPVLLNGRQLPKDIFIAKPVFVQQWRGLNIAVVSSNGYRDRNINFHGITLTCDLPMLVCKKKCLRVMVDVCECPELKLVLPSRKEVVQNDFYGKLREECERLLYQYVETLPAHDLSYKDWLRAKELGIVLPEAQPVLNTFLPDTANREDRYIGEELLVPDTALLVDWEDSVTPRDEQMLWHTFNASERPWRLMAHNDRYRGYQWYDQLPRLTWVDFEVQVGSTWHHPSQAPNLELQNHLLVDAICGNVTIKHADGTTSREAWQTDVYIDGERDYEQLDRCVILLTKAPSITEDELVSLLEDCFFDRDDDSDDGYDVQLTRFNDEAYELALSVLKSNEAGLIARLERVLRRSVLELLPPKTTVEIAISPGDWWTRPMTVRFKDS